LSSRKWHKERNEWFSAIKQRFKSAWGYSASPKCFRLGLCRNKTTEHFDTARLPLRTKQNGFFEALAERPRAQKNSLIMKTVYILVSEHFPDRYYIGITDDLDRRLYEHNQATTGYSKRYAPWRVETAVLFHNDLLAFLFEKYLKSGSGFAFLKKRLIGKP